MGSNCENCMKMSKPHIINESRKPHPHSIKGALGEVRLVVDHDTEVHTQTYVAGSAWVDKKHEHIVQQNSCLNVDTVPTKLDCTIYGPIETIIT